MYVSDRLNACEYLLPKLDELIETLKLINPEHHFFLAVAQHPIIQFISQSMGYNPAYFAEPLRGGECVRFDLKKLQAVRVELIKIRDELMKQVDPN